MKFTTLRQLPSRYLYRTGNINRFRLSPANRWGSPETISLLMSKNLICVFYIVCRHLPKLLPKMVGQARLELATPRLSSACSNQLSYRPIWLFGGGNRIRTDDILLAKQALYQLSYTPLKVSSMRAVDIEEWFIHYWIYRWKIELHAARMFYTWCAIIINKSWTAFANSLRHHCQLIA